VGALTGLGIAYAKSGDQTTARKIIQEMESLSKRSYVSPIYTESSMVHWENVTKNSISTPKPTKTVPNISSG
jgi:hypothetical protein